jgi:hypothetical protein
MGLASPFTSPLGNHQQEDLMKRKHTQKRLLACAAGLALAGLLGGCGNGSGLGSIHGSGGDGNSNASLLNKVIGVIEGLSTAQANGGAGIAQFPFSAEGATGTITGRVAAGHAIGGATVKALAWNGVSLTPVTCATATTAASGPLAGAYNIALSSCPANGGFVVLEVDATTPTEGAITLQGVWSPSQGGVANITTLTTAALDACCNADPSLTEMDLAGDFVDQITANGTPMPVTAAQANAATASVMSGIEGNASTLKADLDASALSTMSYSAWQGLDLFTGNFAANHSGEDAVMDSVRYATDGATPYATITMLDANGQSLATIYAANRTASSAQISPQDAAAQAAQSDAQATGGTAAITSIVDGNYVLTYSSSGGLQGSCNLTVAYPQVSATCSDPNNGSYAASGTDNGGILAFGTTPIAFVGGLTATGGSGTWGGSGVSGNWSITSSVD